MSIDDRDKESSQIVRRLIRITRSGALATHDTEMSGSPYASFVLMSCTMEASPLLLLSDLARHSRNITEDGRVSILIGKLGTDALSQTRATLIGRMVRSEDENQRARFIRHHSGSRKQTAFNDFHLYRMEMESIHLIAGFGRIETLAATEVTLSHPGFSELAAAEGDIVQHMNVEHSDAVIAISNNLADRVGRDWIITGIDPEGIDLGRIDTESRVDFEFPIDGAESARTELARLAAQAHG